MKLQQANCLSTHFLGREKRKLELYVCVRRLGASNNFGNEIGVFLSYLVFDFLV